MSEPNTRERLLDTAEALISANGYANTSLREITAQAGANLAAVNYHFGSKEGLVSAMLERRLTPLNKKRTHRLCDPGNGGRMRRLIPLLLLCTAIIAVFIEGCSVHQIRQARMDTDLPVTYATPAPETTAFSPEKWWLVFHDETLNALMEKSFEGNLDLAQYVARLQQALASGRQRSAERLPYVNLEGTASRSQQNSVSGEIVGTAQSYSVAAGYEVDLWRKVVSRDRAQAIEAAATRQELHALYLTLKINSLSCRFT